jgi:hypothetical protein
MGSPVQKQEIEGGIDTVRIVYDGADSDPDNTEERES